MASLTAAPTLTTSYVYKRDMSELDLPSLTDGNTYTTPSMLVPSSDANPYILRTSNPSGTVFIAVGAIVGAILLSFICYHLFKSLTASRLAKKAFINDKQIYEKYQNNNNTAYGLTPSTTLNMDYGHGRSYSNFNNQSMGKLPLLSHHPSKSVTGLGGSGTSSQLGDTSTLYQSEFGGSVAASKHDLTKMFISPTAEVMQHKRGKSSQFGSTTDFGVLGSQSNLSNSITDSPVHGGRNSMVVPNLYVNHEINNSDYSLGPNGRNQDPSLAAPDHLQHLSMNTNANHQLNTKSNRKTIPSMYLEDLIDE